MKSKVTKLDQTGTWTSGEGKTFYKFTIEFDNGDKADYLQATPEMKHAIGSEPEYEITENAKGYKKIKFLDGKKDFTKGGYSRFDPAEDAKRQAMIVRQSSVKVAADLVGYGKISYDDLLITAQIITDWALGNTKAEKMYEPTNEMPY